MSRPDRGQTTLDFAIGTGVFLLTVIFVLAYAPTVFDPFAGGTGANLIAADRAATTLSGDLLAVSTAEPGTLSTACVGAFFGESVEGACDESFDDLDADLSLDGRNVNVTLHSPDAGVESPAQPEWADDPLTRSNSGAAPSDVAVATRTVSLDGGVYRLTVRVW